MLVGQLMLLIATDYAAQTEEEDSKDGAEHGRVPSCVAL